MSLLVLFSAPEKRTIPFGSFRKELRAKPCTLAALLRAFEVPTFTNLLCSF
jgi:hypothetical protein